MTKEDDIVKRVGEKHQPIFDRLTRIFKHLLKKISENTRRICPVCRKCEHHSGGARINDLFGTLQDNPVSPCPMREDPRINDLFGTLRRYQETVDMEACQIAYEINAECEKAGIKSARKSTLVPAPCLHCGKLFLKRVRLSKTNINDVYYGDAMPIRKAKQRKYCSRKCANQAFYMRKMGKKVIEQRTCAVCGKPLPQDASLKRITCSDKCRQQKKRKSISLQSP